MTKAKKITFNEHDFSSQVARIEKNRDALTGIKPSIADRQSESKAMDEFEKRFREIDSFIQQYRIQLNKDVGMMRKKANALKRTDSKSATIFQKLDSSKISIRTKE